MNRLTRDGTAKPVSSRDQILRHERGQKHVHFPCSESFNDWGRGGDVTNLSLFREGTA